MYTDNAYSAQFKSILRGKLLVTLFAIDSFRICIHPQCIGLARNAFTIIIEKVESWAYQIGNYSMLGNIQNENLKARYAMIFRLKRAAFRLNTREYDL